MENKGMEFACFRRTLALEVLRLYYSNNTVQLKFFILLL